MCVGADIGKCPFDLSTVRHGVFLYIINAGKPIKTTAICLHTGHADVPSRSQHVELCTVDATADRAGSGANRDPGRQIGGCLRESRTHVKDASKLLFPKENQRFAGAGFLCVLCCNAVCSLLSSTESEMSHAAIAA